MLESVGEVDTAQSDVARDVSAVAPDSLVIDNFDGDLDLVGADVGRPIESPWPTWLEGASVSQRVAGMRSQLSRAMARVGAVDTGDGAEPSADAATASDVRVALGEIVADLENPNGSIAMALTTYDQALPKRLDLDAQLEWLDASDGMSPSTFNGVPRRGIDLSIGSRLANLEPMDLIAPYHFAFQTAVRPRLDAAAELVSSAVQSLDGVAHSALASDATQDGNREPSVSDIVGRLSTKLTSNYEQLRAPL